jgi:hypothetical protein
MSPLTSAMWTVQTAEAVPSATRNSPVSKTKLELVVVRPAAIHDKTPAVIITAPARTLVAFHTEDAGFRICMAGSDAATTRPAANEFTNASKIEIVFKLIPPYSTFLIIG